MDTDCDDAGALLMLINAHKEGKINLSGVIADSICAHAAPFCKSVLTYYGLDLPVGEIYSHIEVTQRHGAYLEHQKRCVGRAHNKELCLRNGRIYPSTEAYIKLLSEAHDGGVTVLCVGMLSALAEAIKARSDLFERKVKEIVVMGNPYKENDFNFSMDARATREFFELCPCPVTVSYEGSDVITGQYLDKTLDADNPIRRAYEIWTDGQGRSSWDLIATLFAMEQNNGLFEVRDVGKISYDEKKRVSYIDKSERAHRVISLGGRDKEVQEILNGLLK